MASPEWSRGCGDVLLTSDVIIRGLKGTCSIPPAQIALGSASVLLTAVQDDLGLGRTCADVCQTLCPRVKGTCVGELDRPSLEAIRCLTIQSPSLDIHPCRRLPPSSVFWAYSYEGHGHPSISATSEQYPVFDRTGQSSSVFGGARTNPPQSVFAVPTTNTTSAFDNTSTNPKNTSASPFATQMNSLFRPQPSTPFSITNLDFSVISVDPLLFTLVTSCGVILV